MDVDYRGLIKKYNEDDLGSILKGFSRDFKHGLQKLPSGAKNFVKNYPGEIKKRTPDSLGVVSYTNHYGAFIETMVAGLSDVSSLIARGAYIGLTHLSMPIVTKSRDFTYDAMDTKRETVSDGWSLHDSAFTFATTFPFKWGLYEAAARISPEPYDSGEIWTASIIMSLLGAAIGGRAYRTGDIFQAGFGENELSEEVRHKARKRSIRMAAISLGATAAIYLAPNPGIDLLEKFFDTPDNNIEEMSMQKFYARKDIHLEDMMEYKF